MGLLIFGSTAMLTSEGLKNRYALSLRNIWIRTQVRDINNLDFSSLDEENPPVPLAQSRR